MLTAVKELQLTKEINSCADLAEIDPELIQSSPDWPRFSSSIELFNLDVRELELKTTSSATFTTRLTFDPPKEQKCTAIPR